MFAAYGLPTQLVSDNGPQFTVEEFENFLRSNGIKHIKCAPYHPASNGAVERLVQTFKKAMKSSKDSYGNAEQAFVSRIIAQHPIAPQMKHLVNCSWVTKCVQDWTCYYQAIVEHQEYT